MEFTTIEHLLLSKYNQPFVSAVAAALVAQSLKAVVAVFKREESPKAALVMSGGMPSAHSALALSLFSSVIWLRGWTSTTTGIAGILALVILYDALIIRRAVEEHSLALRFLMQRVAPEELTRYKMPRSLGHTFIEVIAGCLLGVLVARVVLWMGTV